MKKVKILAEEAGAVYATQTGQAYDIGEMPDPVFADKILGDGVCILPRSECVYAPVSGTVLNVSDKGYAFGICADWGGEILVHIGVDTVRMPKGTFRTVVTPGQQVRRGDILCHVDLKAIRRAGHAVHTAVTVCNPEEFEILERSLGVTKGGKTPVLRCRRRTT